MHESGDVLPDVALSVYEDTFIVVVAVLLMLFLKKKKKRTVFSTISMRFTDFSLVGKHSATVVSAR